MDYQTLSPRQMERHALTIHPGAWAIDDQRPLSTLLGSCVAVCLFDPLARIGGLNHFLLPSMRSDTVLSTVSLSGERAMDVLLEALLHRGARRANLRAKAFGGGRVLGTLDVGSRNASFAREWLARESIPLVAADLLGPWSRKLIFLPASGEAFCRRLTAVVDWTTGRAFGSAGNADRTDFAASRKMRGDPHLLHAARFRRGRGIPHMPHKTAGNKHTK